ncbi:MFS transporter [Allonocardiopsis opalescens]|uniref:DHA2 family multidrug resistance protein-like MFS transporter n=1 Tax=Allonocardiopsis opalescens TaxID=1144618 RepID=A0A2T0QCZ0_9ACTN|nr:MFS transporter [Allonocardiopsis opalescens]PRY01768.1 DHA2 family multidrug resistance protein-like MFS transporter [Allonocardiopsis opalescens]
MTELTPKAGRREWIGLAVLVLPALLASMDLSVLFMALPWLSASLEPTGPQQLWIMDIYGFLLAGLLVTMGTLGDRIGRRRLLLIGGVAFGAASVLAAYSSSPEMLIAARALLGIGGAILAPSTLSLIRNMFHDENQRNVAVGVWTGAFSGGIALGPLFGGLLLEYFWWGSVFLVNVPVMVLLLIAGPLLLPEFKDPNPGRFDLVSAVLSIAAVLPIIYGIKEVAANGLEWAPLAFIVVGLFVGYAFVRRQNALPDPLIDTSLFRRSEFSASIGALTMLAFASAGVGMQVTQYMQLILGLGPFEAALWMIPTLFGTVIGVALGTQLVKRFRPGFIVGAGLGIIAVGFAVLTQITVESTLMTIIGGYIAVTLGTGMVATLANNMVITTAPPERAGAAAALSETGGEFGGALGIAIMGSIAVGVYHGTMVQSLPDGLSPEAAEAASGTLGGAAAVAAELPGELGGQLLDAAHLAFTNGINVLAVVGVVIMLTGAVVVSTLLRKVRTPSENAELSG